MPDSRDRADAIVLGAGVVGCATALALARRGLAVTLLDQKIPGHAAGSSHGDGRILRFSYAEPAYLELALEAVRRWDDLAQAQGERLLRRCGNWDCGPHDSPDVAALVANLARGGQRHETLSAADSRRRFPQLEPPPDGSVLFQPDGGLLLADRALGALLGAAERAGARLLTNTRIEHVGAGESGFEIATEDGRRLGGRRLVITAGAWSAPLLAELGLELPLTVTREQVAYFRPIDAVDHSPDAMPTVIDWDGDRDFYALPALSSAGVKAGWHHGGTLIEDPKAPAQLDEANLAAVQGFVRRRLPHLDPEPAHVEHCLYTNTPDHHFLVDRHPHLPGLAFGAGFSGHGFKFAPVIGEALAALVCDEAVPAAIASFSLDRLD